MPDSKKISRTDSVSRKVFRLLLRFWYGFSRVFLVLLFWWFSFFGLRRIKKALLVINYLDYFCLGFWTANPGLRNA